jgi:polysaccharide pyruvyl transferase WcaK-like protein
MNSFFSPKTQFENVGDTLINRELIDLISKHSKLRLDSSRSPSRFVDDVVQGNSSIGVTSSGYFRYLLSGCYKKITSKNDVYFFLSPGGYFGELNFKEFAKQTLNNLVLFIMKILGVKIVLVGVSYERMGGRHLKIMRNRATFLHRHFPRDKKSNEYIRGLGVKTDGSMPDLAFNLPFLKNKESNKIKSIVFSFRADQFPKQEEAAREIVRLFNQLVPSDISFKFYWQVERDELVMKSLYYYCLSDFPMRNPKLLSGSQTVEQSREILINHGWVVSNRLHVLLIASSVGAVVTPCISKEFNNKVEGLFSDLGYGSSLLKYSKEAYIDKAYMADLAISSDYFEFVRGELQQCFLNIFSADDKVR